MFQIDSGATVSISGVTIENGGEGGVTNSGTLILNNCTLTGNQGGRGAINNVGTLTVTNSTFSGNSCLAPECGGIMSNRGTAATVANSTFSGGGISNQGPLTVTNSTFSGSGYITNVRGTLTVTNSTFSGGGGISNADGTLMVSFSTFSGGGAIGNAGASLTTTTVKNTLLANSSGCGNNLSATNFISEGHNLSENTSCVSFFTAIGDLNNTPAGLDPNGLQNNGGPTQTIALVAGSPAIDAIPVSPPNYCTDVAGNPVTTDQRGVTCPQGPACDIGAYEKTGIRVPTDTDQCKDNGWMTLFQPDGSPFKNQGDCIQYVNTGK